MHLVRETMGCMYCIVIDGRIIRDCAILFRWLCKYFFVEICISNTSTHMDGRVATLIRSKGAYLLYIAPYSPDLNPIELAFNVYKSQLKKNERAFQFDWYRTHLQAMNHVDSDICIKEFRKCGVPLSNDILTTEECEIILALSIIINE